MRHPGRGVMTEVLLQSLPHEEETPHGTVTSGTEETEELSAVALLNWEDQIVWGIE